MSDMNRRFTYRSLGGPPSAPGEHSVWSAAPDSADLEDLVRQKGRILALDPRLLSLSHAEAEGLAFVQREYPEVESVRFELTAIDAEVDADRSLLFLDVAARLVATVRGGKDFSTEEYDHYAAQVVVDAVERRLG